MPWKWIKPKIFMQYRGIKIYHTYRHDVISDPNQYLFTFDENEPDLDQYIFDIRGLVEHVEIDLDLSNPEQIKEIIKVGMNAGHLINSMPQHIAQEYYDKYGPFYYFSRWDAAGNEITDGDSS